MSKSIKQKKISKKDFDKALKNLHPYGEWDKPAPKDCSCLQFMSCNNCQTEPSEDWVKKFNRKFIADDIAENPPDYTKGVLKKIKDFISNELALQRKEILKTVNDAYLDEHGFRDLDKFMTKLLDDLKKV